MEDNLITHEDHAGSVTGSNMTSNVQSLWIDKIVFSINSEMHLVYSSSITSPLLIKDFMP